MWQLTGRSNINIQMDIINKMEMPVIITRHLCLRMIKKPGNHWLFSPLSLHQVSLQWHTSTRISQNSKSKNHYNVFEKQLNFSFRSEKENLKIPFDIEDAKQLGRVLDRYKDLYYFEVMTGICLLYLLWVIFETFSHDISASGTFGVAAKNFKSLSAIFCPTFPYQSHFKRDTIYEVIGRWFVILFLASRRLQYPEVFSSRSCSDFCSNFPSPWHWFVCVQLLVLHCAICCLCCSDVDWWNIISQRKLNSGVIRCRSIKTTCWATFCSYEWHHYYQIGLLISLRRLLEFHWCHSVLELS